MKCLQLYQGLDMTCKPIYRKYYQQAVLINRDDVSVYQILTSGISISGDFTCRHRIRFELKEGKTGYLIKADDNGAVLLPTWDRTEVEGFPAYSHSVVIPVTGVDEQTKCVLTQLDAGNYFAAVQFTDGTVEIYGFENGLKSDDYTYDAQGGGGGSTIPLKSDSKALEDDPPFIYQSGNPGEETQDFNNLFSDNPDIKHGDFNDDFNDDFYNL